MRCQHWEYQDHLLDGSNYANYASYFKVWNSFMNECVFGPAALFLFSQELSSIAMIWIILLYFELYPPVLAFHVIFYQVLLWNIHLAILVKRMNIRK